MNEILIGYKTYEATDEEMQVLKKFFNINLEVKNVETRDLFKSSVCAVDVNQEIDDFTTIQEIAKLIKESGCDLNILNKRRIFVDTNDKLAMECDAFIAVGGPIYSDHTHTLFGTYVTKVRRNVYNFEKLYGTIVTYPTIDEILNMTEEDVKDISWRVYVEYVQRSSMRQDTLEVGEVIKAVIDNFSLRYRAKEKKEINNLKIIKR